MGSREGGLQIEFTECSFLKESRLERRRIEICTVDLSSGACSLVGSLGTAFSDSGDFVFAAALFSFRVEGHVRAALVLLLR